MRRLADFQANLTQDLLGQVVYPGGLLWRDQGRTGETERGGFWRGFQYSLLRKVGEAHG
jgi:hypothetical protein